MLVIHARRLVLATSGVLAVLLTACDRSPDPPHALLLVVIDTLRADHVGAYGYGFDTSPTLDSLAEAGVRFDEATAPAPITLPSVTSLLTGLYPRSHGVRDNGVFALDGSVQTLAERFHEAGFRTGAVVGSAVLAPDRGLTRGFETYDAEFGGEYPVWEPTLLRFAERIGSDRRRATPVTDRAIDLVESFGDQRFFLLVHYFDVHHYYDPPPEFGAAHPGRPYDGEIAYTDSEIGRLLAVLPERTLVAVVGDHGESLGEHGEPEHGFLLHQATARVPMIVSGPGVPAGKVRQDVVSVADLEPTLARAFDLPSDGEPRDGFALEWKRETNRAVFSETFRTLVSYGWSELRAVRQGDWKLVRGPDEDLFNLRNDPGELNDLGKVGPYERLAALLDSVSHGDDPRAVYEQAHGATDVQSRELLESLGYTSVEPDVVFPEERPHPRDELPRWFDRQMARVGLRTAIHFFTQGQVDQALAAVDSTLTLDPEMAEAYTLRGECFAHLGRNEEAGKAYRESLRLNPENADVRRLLEQLEDR